MLIYETNHEWDSLPESQQHSNPTLTIQTPLNPNPENAKEKGKNSGLYLAHQSAWVYEPCKSKLGKGIKSYRRVRPGSKPQHQADTTHLSG